MKAKEIMGKSDRFDKDIKLQWLKKTLKKVSRFFTVKTGRWVYEPIILILSPIVYV